MIFSFHRIVVARRVISLLVQRCCVGFALLCAGSQLLHAQQDLETSVPANWSASAGTLSISPYHYKMGSQSLRWNWNAGSVITISTPGITAADVTNSTKGTCDFWVWNGTAIPGGKLRVEFMNGATAQYWFDFNLDYVGWRHAVRSYVYDMSKVASPNATFTSVRITAPASGTGSFYLDAVRWVGTAFTRIRDAQNPDITGSGSSTAEASTFALVPDIAATAPTAAELAELATIRSRWIAANKGSSAPTATAVTSAGSSFAGMNLVEDANGIRGNVIGTTHGVDPATVGSWAITLARDYAWATSTATDSRDKMMQLIRHLLDQAQTANSDQIPTGGAAGYDFDTTPNAIILMASACDAATKQQLFDYYRWIYWMGEFWKPPFAGANTDDIYLESMQELGAVLFFTPNDTEAVRQLKGYKRYMERFLTFTDGGVGGIKPDGLGFHHNGHYNSYMYAYKTLTDAIYQLRGTSFQINQTAYENFRLAVFAELRMSAFNLEAIVSSNFGYFSNSLCGRKPFSTNVQYRQIDLQHLGELGGQFYGQSADSVVARAYNRRYGVSNFALFTPYGVEDSPDGFYQFNYSPLGIHRRANWVASIHSTNAAFWSSEIYATENRYGRYQAYGAMEVLYDGGPTVSGQQLNGYDWNQPSGTTTIVLPDAKLISGNTIEMVRSQIDFSGALAFHDGRNGLYASNFQETNLTNHNPSFVWRKSWFAFDSEIVCLGSNIANNDAANPTVTTLFQGSLATQGTAITLDGGAVTSFPYSSTASGAGAHWLLDAQGTGFITQPGADVKISRSTQTSAHHSGNGTSTTGDFAKAWLDHGVAPNGAGYEYAVIPGTTAAAMASAASDHGNAATKPYQVIERDSTAHVVKWKADGKTGYAIFSTTALPAATKSAGLLAAVQRPCLVMTQNGTNHDAWVSLVDPNMNLTNNVSVPRTLDLSLNGRWALDAPPAGVSIVSADSVITVIRVTTAQGAAVHLHLIDAEAASGYYAWIAGTNAGAKSAPNDDADGDGIENIVEFVLGSAPDAPNSGTPDPAMPQAQKSGGNFVFSFSRADAAEQGNLQVLVETGASPSALNTVYQIGATTSSSSAGVTVSENGSAPDTVTVTIPASGASACFARLKVVAQ